MGLFILDIATNFIVNRLEMMDGAPPSRAEKDHYRL